MSLDFPEWLPPQADWFLSSYGLLATKHTFQVTWYIISCFKFSYRFRYAVVSGHIRRSKILSPLHWN